GGALELSAPELELAAPVWRRGVAGDGGRAVHPRASLVDVTEVQARERRAARGQELEPAIAEHLRLAVCLFAAAERDIGDDLRAREHVRAVEHLRLGELAFALVRHGVHARREPADLLDVAARAGPEMDVGGPARVRHRDD